MRATAPWRFLQAIARVLTTLLFDLKVYGAHRVPDRGGVLLVSNHQSYLDPVLLGVRLRRPLSYLAKSELFRHKPFAWFIRSLGAFPVRQGAGDVGAMKETIARLQEGHALNIYPEGSRTQDGQLLPIERGIGLVVKKAKVPVVPVVIDGSFQAWPRSCRLFHPHPIRVMYGPPMDLSGLRADEVVRTIDRTLHAMFDELRRGPLPLDRRDMRTSLRRPEPVV